MIDWLVEALLGSAVLIGLVLVIRAPVRRQFGPAIAYALWAIPAIRLVLPPLPATVMPLKRGVAGMTVLVAGDGPGGAFSDPAVVPQLALLLVAAWAAGAVATLAGQSVRHARFCRRLLAAATPIAHEAGVEIVMTDVDGPLAFGVGRRYVAVPRDFLERYDAAERELVIAHELTHHRRGDLIANWIALAVVALHWFNPVAWAAFCAFRADQEFANDARVLAARGARDRLLYAHVLVKASGIALSPACNLTPRGNLKGRLTMLTRPPLSSYRLAIGGTVVAILASTALAATASGTAAIAPAAAGQARTIIVKLAGGGAFHLIVSGAEVTPGQPSPGGARLPADFDPPGGCNVSATATPTAMVIKGGGDVETYTVMCAAAATATTRAAMVEGLASLRKLRGMVATQNASAVFPEAERRHALGAIDASVVELEGDLARAG